VFGKGGIRGEDHKANHRSNGFHAVTVFVVCIMSAGCLSNLEVGDSLNQYIRSPQLRKQVTASTYAHFLNGLTVFLKISLLKSFNYCQRQPLVPNPPPTPFQHNNTYVVLQNLGDPPSSPIIINVHIKPVLIPLLHLLIQGLKQLCSLLRKRKPQVRNPIAELINKLVLFRKILILVFDEVIEVGPLQVYVLGLVG
jgi:hypothetical protein